MKLGFQESICLVKLGWIEQKSPCGKFEPTVGFADAAFSQQEDLISGCQGVDGRGPFFEGDIECRFGQW